MQNPLALRPGEGGGSFTLSEVPQARPAIHPALPETYERGAQVQKNPDLLAYMIIALVVVGIIILITYLNIQWIE